MNISRSDLHAWLVLWYATTTLWNGSKVVLRKSCHLQMSYEIELVIFINKARSILNFSPAHDSAIVQCDISLHKLIWEWLAFHGLTKHEAPLLQWHNPSFLLIAKHGIGEKKKWEVKWLGLWYTFTKIKSVPLIPLFHCYLELYGILPSSVRWYLHTDSCKKLN